jgi:hypothetical protein
MAFPVPLALRLADGQPMTAVEVFTGGNGMTLRDWLAGLAMQGYLAGRNSTADAPDNYRREVVAGQCVAYADALIAALGKAGDQ